MMGKLSLVKSHVSSFSTAFTQKLKIQNNNNKNPTSFNLHFWATAAPVGLGLTGKHLCCPGKGSSSQGSSSGLKPDIPFQVNGNRLQTADISEKG